MTLPDAHSTARNAADRFGKPFRVYRLPAWPAAVYGATSIELPREAEILATYPDDAPPAPSAPPATAAQGSLF